MSFKGGGRQPDPVNPWATAGAQASFNVDAAKQQRALNMTWQEGPGGSLSYLPTGTETEGIPDFKRVTTLSPDQQGLYDTSNRLAQQYGNIAESQLGAVRDRFSTPFDMSQFGDAPDAPDISSLGAGPEVNPEVRQRQQDAILKRFSPQLDRNSEAMRTRLANQGFARGSEGFSNAMQDDNQARNDFYLGADIQAGDEMARMFGLQNQGRARDISEMTQDYRFATSARDRAIQEGLLERNQPLSELSSFITGSQPRMPQFGQTPQGTINPADYMGAAYATGNQQQNQYAQQNANYRQNLQGLYGLAGTGAGLASQGWGWGS